MPDPFSVAIIGSREPTAAQAAACTRALDWLAATHPGAVVRSGCATGIDRLALEGARGRGLATFGCAPWGAYEPATQALCDQVENFDRLPPAERAVALASVYRYHPGAGRLTQGPLALHGRNQRIVAPARLVIAFPSANKGGGGTGQGIRLAVAAGITAWCFGPDGQRVDPARYCQAKPLWPAERPDLLICLARGCGATSWVARFDDPSTSTGCCPACGHKEWFLVGPEGQLLG